MASVPDPLPPSPPASPFILFRKPNFLRLWLGSVTSAAGTAVGSLILIWLVYVVTRSPLTISLLGIVQFLPTVAFGLLAGALIDRWDRRRLMIACDAARCVCFGVLALYVLVVGVNTAVLIGIVFVVATFSTIFRPAANAAIPRILGAAEMTDGNGLLQGGSTAAQFVGSPVGGLLLVTAGATVGLALNALTFAVSGVLIFMMVIPSPPRAPALPAPSKGSLLGEIRAGLGFLRSQRALLVITLTAMVGNFFLTIWGGFLVFYVAGHLHAGATDFAILVASGTGGFALGSVLPGRLHTDRSPGLWLLPTWGTAGIFVVGLAAVSSLGAAIALEVAASTCLSIVNTTWLTGVQRTVPDEFLGRYFATDEAGSFAMVPAAMAVGGVLVLLWGIEWTFVFAGVGAVVSGIPMFLSTDVKGWGQRRHSVPSDV